MSAELLLGNSSNKIYLGEILNRTVVYVDWNNPLSTDVIREEISFYSRLGADGVLIKNNCFRDDSINASRDLDDDLYRYIPDVSK